MLRFKQLTIACLTIVLFTSSCKNDEKKGTSKSGFMYTIIAAETGDKLKSGDIVKVQLKQFIDDSLLNSTYDNMPIYVKVDTSQRPFDFTELLPEMKVNDSAVCVFPVKEIIKRAGGSAPIPDVLKNKKNVNVYVKIINRFVSDSLGRSDYEKEMQRFSQASAAKQEKDFVAASQRLDSVVKTIKEPVQKLPNGVYIQMLQKGSGAKIKAGDSVAVAYKGMLDNNTVFETTTPTAPFVLVVGEGRAVEGFDSGIMALSFGDKARIYIPAKLAYGANGAGDKIKPFSNLIFEVEVNTTK